MGCKYNFLAHNQYSKSEMSRIENIEFIALGESCFSYLYVCVFWVTTHFLLRAMFVQVWKALVSFSDFQILFHGIRRGLRYRRGDADGRSWVERAPGTSPLPAKVVRCLSGSHVGVLCDISSLKKKDSTEKKSWKAADLPHWVCVVWSIDSLLCDFICEAGGSCVPSTLLLP